MERSNSLSQSLKMKHSEIKRMNSEYMNKPGVIIASSMKNNSMLPTPQSPSNRGGMIKKGTELGFINSAGGAGMSNQQPLSNNSLVSNYKKGDKDY